MEKKLCPRCNKELKKCLLNEEMTALWICQDEDCPFPFDEKTIDNFKTTMTTQDVKNDVVQRMKQTQSINEQGVSVYQQIN